MFTTKKTLSRSNTFALLPLALLLSACGGGGDSSNNTPNTTTSSTEPRTVTASDWQNTNILARENASGLTIEEQGSQLKFTITDLDIISSEHTQIFLDTDNNPDTGYQFDNTAWAVTGVDYILENSSLFKSTANDSTWSWNTNVGEVTSYTRTDTSVEIIVEKSLFKEACNNINAGTMARDEDWQISSFYPVANTLQSYPISACDNVIDTTPPVLTLKGSDPLYVPEDSPYFNDPGVTAIDNVDGDISANVQVTSDYFETHGELVDLSLGDTETELRYSVTDNAGNTAKITRTVIVEHRAGSFFIVDGDNREWSHVAPLIQTNEGSLSVVDDLADDNDTSDDTVVLLLEIPSLQENIQIYLDTDNNSETGYPLYDATIPNVVAGADYLIENGHLNKSLSNSFQWNWEYDIPLPAHPRFEYVRNGDLVEIKIPRHLITSDKIKINIASIDAKWQQAVWFNDMTPALFELLSTSNNAPVAVDDISFTNSGRTITIDVLANDTDVDGNQLTITSITQPPYGKASIVYGPAIDFYPLDFVGTTSFSYTVSDGRGGSANATVTVTSNDYDRPPVTADENVSTSINTPIFIDVLANDTDPNEDTLILGHVDDPSNGTTNKVNGGVLYTPNNGFTGTDSFAYGVSDGQHHDFAVVTITVTQPVNNAPVAVDDAVTTGHNQLIFIQVLENDIDLDGDLLTITNTTSPSQGQIVSTSFGSILFDPREYIGTISFSYTVVDGRGGIDEALVTITSIDSGNYHFPEARDDSVSTPMNTPILIDVLANDIDLDGDTINLIRFDSGSNGTTTKVNGDILYTPTTGFTGTDTFHYAVDDGHGFNDSGKVTVTVTPLINNPPNAVDDEASLHVTRPGAGIRINVLDNDTDSDGHSLTVTNIGTPQNGRALEELPVNTISYFPNDGFAGTDSFTYTISDGNGGTSTAEVTVIVTQVNNSPDAVEDAPATDFDKAITIEVLANDTDPDGDTLTITSITQPPVGKTTLNSDGTILFDPQNNVGSISFSYTISDGRGGTDSTVVTVASSDPDDGNDNYPIIVNENVTTSINKAIFIDVLANDSDLDGDTLILDQVDNGSNGTTTKINGGVLYTPATGFTGTDSFHYGVHDGHGHNGAGLVTITVTN